MTDFQVDSDRANAQIEVMLKDLDTRAKHLPWRKMFILGERTVLRNFHEGGRPKPWAPLSPNTPVNRKHGGNSPLQDTRTLLRSIGARMDGANGFKVATRNPIAAFQNFGTDPYVIRPVNASALRFKIAGIGVVYRKIVHHPGIPARPFMIWQKDDPDLFARMISDHLAGERSAS